MNIAAVNFAENTRRQSKLEDNRNRFKQDLAKKLSTPIRQMMVDRISDQTEESKLTQTSEAIQRSLKRLAHLIHKRIKTYDQLKDLLDLTNEELDYLRSYANSEPENDQCVHRAMQIHLKYRLMLRERTRVKRESRLNEPGQPLEKTDLLKLTRETKSLMEMNGNNLSDMFERKSEPQKPMNRLLKAFQLNATQAQRRKSLLMRDGQFEVGERILDHPVKKSLNLFTSKSKIRVWMVTISHNAWFNHFIMLVIFINCVVIALYDHSQKNVALNRVTENISNLLTIIYFCEAGVKIIADGFVMEPGTYLRNTSNVFDFMILIFALIRIAINQHIQSSRSAYAFFRIVRTLRVFKLFAGFQKVPQLHKQIVTLGKALKGLTNVALFLLFFFILLSIFGLQLFGDDMYNACRTTTQPVQVGGKLVWPRAVIDPSLTQSGICSKRNSSIGGFHCPLNTTCGSYLDFGLPLIEDGVKDNPILNYNIGGWQNIGSSFILVFQIITQDNWSMNMYAMISATEFFLPVLFAFVINMVGSYFLMNLMLAVIMDEYVESEQVYLQETRERKAQEEEKLKQKQFSLGIMNHLALIKQMANANKQAEEQKQQDILKDLSSWSSSNSGYDGLNAEAEADLNEPNPRVDHTANVDESMSAIEENKDELSVQQNQQVSHKRRVSLLPLLKNEGEEPSEQNSLRPKNLMLKKLTLGVNKLVTKKQSELLKLEGQINNIGDQAIRQQVVELHKVLTKAADQEPQDQLAAVERLEVEQTKITDQLRMTVRENIAANRRISIIKDEERISAWVTKQISHEDQEASEPRASQIDRLAMNMTQKYQTTTETSGPTIGKTQAAAQTQANAKKLFSDQKAFIKREFLEQRASESELIRHCLAIDDSKPFQFFVTACILGNTILLSLDSFPGTARDAIYQEFFNFVFYLVFVVEMIVKWSAHGTKLFFKERSNNFDVFVIVISTVDLLLVSVWHDSKISIGIVRALRILRLLRVFKLAKVWKSFNNLLSTISSTLKKLGYFLVLVWLFWFTYAIVGKELYAFKMSFTDDGQPLSHDFDFSKHRMRLGYSPDFNFNTFWDSSVSVFLCLASGNWSSIFYNAMRSPDVNQLLSLGFFYTLYIGGRNILFQLFLAILLNEFDERSITETAQAEIQPSSEDPTKQHKGCFHKFVGKLCGIDQNQFLKRLCLDKQGSPGDSDQQGGQSHSSSVHNRSLGLFTTTNPIRKACIWLAAENDDQSSKLDSVIWACIGISCLTMAFDSPLRPSTTKLSIALQYVDYVMTGMFTLEAIIKIIAFGLLFNGNASYFRHYRNQLDFFVVVTSIISVSSSKDFSYIKLLRLTRLARPLKLVFRNEKLKVSIHALMAGIPKIFNLMLIVVLIYVIFGIGAVTFFKGRLFDCKMPTGSEKFMQSVTGINECLNYGGTWTDIGLNFDNFGNSLVQMFMMAQGVSWDSMMLNVIQSTGVQQVQLHHEPYTFKYASIFFMFWMIIGAFLIQNLFVGVVISEFNRQSEKLGKNFLLTEQQKAWIETKLLLQAQRPKRVLKEPTLGCRKFLFRFIQTDQQLPEQRRLSDQFESFIMATICVNTLILCLKWPSMGPKAELSLDIINYICLFIFVAEALIKLTALGLQYFYDGWNIFDFIIVIGSLVFIHPTFKSQKNTVTLIRAFRVGRVFKLFSKLKKLQSIFQTVVGTLPALMNVGMLMLLIIYMFAVVGVEYFGMVKLNAPLTRLQNFQTLPKAFLTLFTVATGDGWDQLLLSMSAKRSVLNDCLENPSYLDYVSNGNKTVGCGSRFATAYLFSFSFTISIIFMNLYIAIILQGYFTQVQKENDYEVQTRLKKFRDAWSKFDNDATGIICKEDFAPLMFEIGKGLGWGENYRGNQTRQNQYVFNIAQNMEDHKKDEQGQYFFTEVLDNLMLFNVIKDQVKLEMSKRGIVYTSEDDVISPESPDRDLRSQLLQSQITHLEEGLNQTDSQLVKQLMRGQTRQIGQNPTGLRRQVSNMSVGSNQSNLNVSRTDRLEGFDLLGIPEQNPMSEESRVIDGVDEDLLQQQEYMSQQSEEEEVSVVPEQVINGGEPERASQSAHQDRVQASVDDRVVQYESD